ncbi:fimbrial protein [Serratia fonticola]|uniref:Fimbrial protein n=1 Tax=Serratia fonticola TaxID=47917 RepID=A0ABY9PRK6_SERFO|nr:fimbrial protein [Serratia fonticola]WMT16056.1 fimbrial protein [Serratia fonticola]WMT16059.1 fimbrial protein [Serratia fonticola]
MKKNIINAVLLSLTIATPAAFAADGTINFVGEITDVACTVDTNSQNLTVTLGKVASSTFSGIGSKAASTQFQLVLKDCPAAATTAVVKFDGTSVAGDNSLLALTPGVDAAEGVAIELSDASQQVVKLFESSQPYTLETGVGSVTNLDFVARYKAISDTITAGVANSSAQFTVIYQ